MTKTKETVIVEEFDESGKIIKRTTTTKETTQQNDYGTTDWLHNQPTVTYRGYTGDTTTTTTTTISNCCNDEIPDQLTLETNKGEKFQ